MPLRRLHVRPMKSSLPPTRREALIAELKKNDLNAGSIEAAMSMIAGTARSMGLTVEG